MTYGDSKVRDMCRSILPATNRKSASEDARRIKRHNRRMTRQTLDAWRSEIDPDDFEGHVFSYDDAPACGSGWDGGNIKAVMWDRRDHDKLGPMLRWAVAITADIDDPVDRRSHMRQILPNNLIGWHAMGHIEFLDEFDIDDRPLRSWQVYRPQNQVPTADEIRDRVLTRIQTNHKRLNFELKRTMIPYGPWMAGKFGGQVRAIKPAPVCKNANDEEFFKWAATIEGRRELDRILKTLEI